MKVLDEAISVAVDSLLHDLQVNLIRGWSLDVLLCHRQLCISLKQHALSLVIFLNQLEKVVIPFRLHYFSTSSGRTSSFIISENWFRRVDLPDPAFPSMMIIQGGLVVWCSFSWQINNKLTDLGLACSSFDPWTGSVLTTEGFHLPPLSWAGLWRRGWW